LGGSGGDPVAVRALALIQSGKHQEAIALLRRALSKHPADLALSDLLCGALLTTGENAQALFVAQRTAELSPNDPHAHLKLALVLHRGAGPEQAEAAVRCVDRAVRLAAGQSQVQRKIVEMYVELDRAEAALSYARALREASPADPNAADCLIDALLSVARVDEALDVDRGVAQDAMWALWRCLHLNYSANAGPDEVLRAHAEAGRLIAAGAPGSSPSFNLTRDSERTLRIAYVSQDFRNRSAAHFIEPIIRTHDWRSFEPFLYYSGNHQDTMTRTLRGKAAGFAMVLDVPDADLAARLRADRIDIAVDLCGHSGFNRLAMFAHRPAPVTITYLGYPNTTGLPGMQYRIVDRITDPPGSESWATEELVRLEGCFLCYAPPGHAPPVARGPCSSSTDSPVTFGTFNTMAKITPQVLDLWARVLGAVPNSRLFMKNRNLALTAVGDRVRQHMSSRGVDPARITLSGELPDAGAHLGAYAHMDIALDPFPYNGTTTTAEALLMGVPVVTMMGDAHRARVTASLLSAAGHPEFIARSENEYIRIASELAADRARLRVLRDTLREELLASSLCDAATLTRGLENAYRTLWRRWALSPIAQTAEKPSSID
jgi:predicted O-linked N-acetylglucosamine transferase (SPINDLY family)